jgi:site-specific DNA-methyltransferase (adenine-specific)
VNPYYSDDHIALYLGDMREVLPTLGQFDACVTDPPYGETSLAWDRWPVGWPALVAEHTRSMWCFGSMRMFLRYHQDIESVGWKLSQDTIGEFEIDTTVWEKHNGAGFQSDRLRRVHELMAHWYRGRWSDVYHEVPRVPYEGPDLRPPGQIHRSSPSSLKHTGRIGNPGRERTNERLVRSVIKVRSSHGRAIHPTEKPPGVLAPLIEYAVPPGGRLLDPFAGSCSTLLTARQLGLSAVGIEADEAMCERAVTERLSTPDLFTEVRTSRGAR